MTKKIIISIAIFVLGVVVGVVGLVFVANRPMQIWMETVYDNELYQAHQAAYRAYFNESNDVGIWAMKNYISLSERSIELVKHDNRWLTSTRDFLFMEYMRLGVLYEKNGDLINANETYKKALMLDHRKRKKEELLALIELFDEDLKKDYI